MAYYEIAARKHVVILVEADSEDEAIEVADNDFGPFDELESLDDSKNGSLTGKELDRARRHADHISEAPEHED